ncbi:MAG: glycoside hydrolase TIM-barrel-like domain-containing protein [Candidatus Midichloria mitochondrii]|nr:glycoside hydrolase TIM-barrel-like domain-containing protein [Candidatus Midichloria mitochondrii]MDJ1288161.1 glycoside hydrolase TIM-barrel-like domain-containing protein [Candidatus Midichloria mitochondrii]MDJ1299045.1 glycoside hydrolase TIM-barrel-like domain-containing protein [Candidatus Midichloria mitochondrii]MDJ1313216.1 glycoside hydrolase TIM-barrel-like domain-containing protein [Candidatus Midichloria mitochondrii]MDJ1583763.1 glycoside hydrolase TIM-barrel-like domain-conta
MDFSIKEMGGYNEFILHYAKLSKGLVDCFIIGSELVGLTSIKNVYKQFPELVKLAEQVRTNS